VRSLNDVTVGDVRPAMLTLLGAVGFVLLIACANVANLMLFRGAARHGESAVRVALGASRVRIARERLAEAALVAAAAAVVALVVAWGMLDAVVALVPGGLPRVDSIRVDAAVVWFTFAIALVTTVLSGVAPALASVRADLVSALRSHAVKTAGRTGERGRRILVVAQVAMAVMVIAGTGLLIRSVLALQAVDVGIAVDGLAFVGLSMPQAKYADRARHERFLDEAIAALESTREIRGATPVNVPPFSGPTGWDVPRFTVEGQSADAAAANPGLNLEAIHPNYFETLQVPLVRGRAFTRFDRAGAENVAIVSDEVARRMWPGGDAIGKRLKMGAPSSPGRWYIVVGVAASTRYRDLVRTRPTLYLPAAQFLVTAQTLIVRTNAGADAVLRIAREKLGAIDADVRVVEVAPYSRMLDAPLARPRFNALLLSAFGTAALLLAAIGLYAVMSVYVRQRDREIGLRVALGATPRDVRRLVIAEGARLASAGALIGVAGATIAARLLEGMLFAVEPLDPLALGGAALLLVAVAAVAAYLPVRRAARVDPIIALRSI
jgi:predicted permease